MVPVRVPGFSDREVGAPLVALCVQGMYVDWLVTFRTSEQVFLFHELLKCPLGAMGGQQGSRK